MCCKLSQIAVNNGNVFLFNMFYDYKCIIVDAKNRVKLWSYPEPLVLLIIIISVDKMMTHVG